MDELLNLSSSMEIEGGEEEETPGMPPSVIVEEPSRMELTSLKSQISKCVDDRVHSIRKMYSDQRERLRAKFEEDQKRLENEERERINAQLLKLLNRIDEKRVAPPPPKPHWLWAMLGFS